MAQIVAESYRLGVSVYSVDGLVQALGIGRPCKSRVGEITKELDELVATFSGRPLDGGRVVNVATVTATAPPPTEAQR